MAASLDVSPAQEARESIMESVQLNQVHSLEELSSDVEAIGREATPLCVKSLLMLSVLRFSS